MFCVKCGKELNDSASFCPFCGSKVKLGSEERERPMGYLNREDVQARYRLMNKPKPSMIPVFFMLLTAVGGIISIAGIYFPFVSGSTIGYHIEVNFNDLAETGTIVFIGLALIGIICGLARKYIGSVISGIVYILLYNESTKEYWANLDSLRDEAYISKGIGVYCMIGGCVIMIFIGLVGFIYKLSSKTK